ncbi:hypothetical protein, partial [Staphylococcus aureus]
QALGFQFKYSNLKMALEDLIKEESIPLMSIRNNICTKCND